MKIAIAATSDIIAKRLKTPLRLTLLFLVGCSSTAFAQTVIAPLQSSEQQYQPSSSQPTYQQPATATTSAIVPSFLQWGPGVTAHPRLAYRFISANGIQSSPGQVVDTTIQTLSPGILTQLGTRWTLDYQPSWDFYSSREFKDSVNHAAILQGGTVYEDWTFAFAQNYSRTFQPSIETGRQSRSENYITTINVNDKIDRRFALETAAIQALNYTTSLNDTKEWSLVEWLHLQWSPHLDTAVGAGPGYIEINNAADINYYKLLGRINWHPGNKLDVQLEAGLDHRKARTSRANFTNNPTANASVRYQVFEHTVLNSDVTRTVSVSQFSNQTVKSLRWTIGLDQRLLGRAQLNLSAGNQKSSYLSTDLASSQKRDDRNRWYGIRLSTVVLKRGTISVFYNFNKNSSNEPGFGFSSDQTGIELRYQY